MSDAKRGTQIHVALEYARLIECAIGHEHWNNAHAYTKQLLGVIEFARLQTFEGETPTLHVRSDQEAGQVRVAYREDCQRNNSEASNEAYGRIEGGRHSTHHSGSEQPGHDAIQRPEDQVESKRVADSVEWDHVSQRIEKSRESAFDPVRFAELVRQKRESGRRKWNGYERQHAKTDSAVAFFRAGRIQTKWDVRKQRMKGTK